MEIRDQARYSAVSGRLAVIVRALLVPCLMGLFSTSVQAAISRADLDALSLSLWQVRAAFYSYTVMEGDGAFEALLEDTIDLAETRMIAVEDAAASEAELALASGLADAFDAYLQLARGNTIRELGYTDRYVTLDLDEASTTLAQTLDDASAAVGPGSDLIGLAIQLEHMASEYMAVSASPSGGGTVGGDNRLDFASAVADFDQALAAARKKHAGNPQVAAALSRVSAKWQFIRESMVKFYENAVPFVVHRYAMSMVEALESAESTAAN